MAKRPPIEVILNAGAGEDANRLEWRIVRALGAHGATGRFTRIERDSTVDTIARCVSRDGVKIVVAAGGDGTVSGVAASLVERDLALGIVPAGTDNHFARDIGLADDVESAVATLLNGRVVRLDVAEVNGRIFINNASLGIYPWILEERLRQRLPPRHWVGVLRATLEAIIRLRPHLHVRLEIDGQSLALKSQLIVVANNRYSLEPQLFGARERIDEGVLAVYVSRRSSRRDLLALVLRTMGGRLRQADSFEVLTAREVVVEIPGRRRCTLAVDGEIKRLELPLRFRIRPAALRVLVPSNRAN